MKAKPSIRHVRKLGLLGIVLISFIHISRLLVHAHLIWFKAALGFVSHRVITFAKGLKLSLFLRYVHTTVYHIGVTQQIRHDGHYFRFVARILDIRMASVSGHIAKLHTAVVFRMQTFNFYCTMHTYCSGLQHRSQMGSVLILASAISVDANANAQRELAPNVRDSNSRGVLLCQNTHDLKHNYLRH